MKGSLMMELALLRHLEAERLSKDGRGQSIFFWEVTKVNQNNNRVILNDSKICKTLVIIKKM